MTWIASGNDAHDAAVTSIVAMLRPEIVDTMSMKSYSRLPIANVKG